MFKQPFVTEEHRMVAKLYRDFVEKEIMPVRQKIDDDKDHKLIKKILQALTDMGHQKAPFPAEYGGGNMTAVLPAAMMHEELGRGDSGIGTAAAVTMIVNYKSGGKS
jgi:alkylation response protein AidB-like acyl-CoA dehydrogenase